MFFVSGYGHEENDSYSYSYLEEDSDEEEDSLEERIQAEREQHIRNAAKLGLTVTFDDEGVMQTFDESGEPCASYMYMAMKAQREASEAKSSSNTKKQKASAFVLSSKCGDYGTFCLVAVRC